MLLMYEAATMVSVAEHVLTAGWRAVSHSSMRINR